MRSGASGVKTGVSGVKSGVSGVNAGAGAVIEALTPPVLLGVAAAACDREDVVRSE